MTRLATLDGVVVAVSTGGRRPRSYRESWGAPYPIERFAEVEVQLDTGERVTLPVDPDAAAGIDWRAYDNGVRITLTVEVTS